MERCRRRCAATAKAWERRRTWSAAAPDRRHSPRSSHALAISLLPSAEVMLLSACRRASCASRSLLGVLADSALHRAIASSNAATKDGSSHGDTAAITFSIECSPSSGRSAPAACVPAMPRRSIACICLRHMSHATCSCISLPAKYDFVQGHSRQRIFPIRYCIRS